MSAKNAFSTISRKVGLTIGTIPIRCRTSSDGITVTNGPSSSEVITYSGCQQFTPYKNLSEIFPPILINNSSNSGGNAAATNNADGTAATADSSENSNNAENGQAADNSVRLNDQSRNGVNSSLTAITENAKGPLKRTDTRKPNYQYIHLTFIEFIIKYLSLHFICFAATRKP